MKAKGGSDSGDELQNGTQQRKQQEPRGKKEVHVSTAFQA